MINITFKEWYLENEGNSVLIDFEKREIIILKSNSLLKSTLYFSESIQDKFNIIDLLKEEFKVGDYKYMALLNGFGEKDYLWRREITTIL